MPSHRWFDPQIPHPEATGLSPEQQLFVAEAERVMERWPDPGWLVQVE